jgi:hypothetical protein
MVMYFVWLLFAIVFVCGFECYELFLVTCVQPALGTWQKEDQKHDIRQLHCKKFEPHPAMFSRCFQ